MSHTKRSSSCAGCAVLVVLLGILAVGITVNRVAQPPGPAPPCPVAEATPNKDRKMTENAGKKQAAGAMVRVRVWDETEKNPIHERAELWFRGYGSWWLKRATSFGSAAEDLGRRPIDVKCTDDEGIQLYPDGRDGRQISVPLKMTAEMNPEGSDRDAIDIIIRDDEVEASGLPIKAAIGKTTITSPRR